MERSRILLTPLAASILSSIAVLGHLAGALLVIGFSGIAASYLKQHADPEPVSARALGAPAN